MPIPIVPVISILFLLPLIDAKVRPKGGSARRGKEGGGAEKEEGKEVDVEVVMKGVGGLSNIDCR